MSYYRPGISHFPRHDTGKWNEVKSKVFLLLYLRYRKGNNSPINLLDIHKLTGVSYRSLATSLPKWYRWKYVKRRLIVKKVSYFKYGVKSLYGYSIAAKGIHWIEEWAQYQLPIDQYLDEIKRWQKLQKEMVARGSSSKRK